MLNLADTIIDEDLRDQLAKARRGQGFATLVEMLAKTQGERDERRKLSPVKRRQAEVRDALKHRKADDEDRQYIHSVLALCGLPYRRPADDTRDYIREYGKNSLVIQSGYLKDPITGKMQPQGLPYGPKARLLLLHICTMAMRQKSPEIEIADSMSAFIRSIGFPVTGGSRGTITQFKEQLNRLAASRMQIGLWQGERTTTVNTQPIEAFDIWLPQHPGQQMLWSSTLKLDQRFYDSLRKHALPMDIQVLRAFSQSAKQIDMVLWLAYRLRSLERPYPISWNALKEQFGANVGSLRKFKQGFAEDLKTIKEVIPKLSVNLSDKGIMLFPADTETMLVTPKRKKLIQ